LVSYDSTEGFQNTFFSLKVESGQPVIEAKILATVAGGHTKKASQVPGIWKLDSAKYLIAANKKIRLVSDNISSFSILGLAKIELNHNSPIIGNPIQLGQNLHIPGGFLKAYDGVNVFEHGFHLYPEISAATATGAIGLSNGAYQYIAVYEWIDSKGQKHSSAPSIFKSLTISGGPKSANVTVQTLKYTSKKENVAAVSIAIYRTVANGTLFYRVTSDVTPLFNNPAADTITFLDTLSDSVLQTKALIYTTGGTLDNLTVPSCNVAAVFKNRLFVGGLEQETSILFSKQHVISEGVAFSDLFSVAVGNQGGSVNAMAVLDEKLVIFKRAGIFILVGDGPTDSGAQNDFLNPQQVASDVGCTEPESIVETPEGVMFKSAKGIYLLNRSLEVSYIGAKVEDFNDYNITGAVVVPNQNQVRFTTAQGTTLVYDYFFKLWTVFTNQASAACIGWISDFVFLKADGQALIEAADFSDNGVPIKTKVSTNWFQFGGVQGFQRIYSGTILGQYVGPHSLKVKVAYDFEDFFDEEFDIDPQPIVEGQAFGSGVFGGTEFGAGTGVYQFKFQPARQKCQAMRIQIEDNFITSESSGGFNISGVTLEIGVKRGTNKVPVGQVMGGS
jgi:hypothetical protein